MGNSDKYSIREKRIRDVAIFAMGVAGTINEMFLVPEPRVSILIFIASLLGLPIALEADEIRRRKNGNE